MADFNPSQHPRGAGGRFIRVGGGGGGGGGSFFERIDFLAEEVGHGDLTMKVEVDQIYAHYQHEGIEFNHPRGGEAEFLRRPLLENSDKRLEGLAARAITPEGSELNKAMIDASEELSNDVYERAPIEFGDLKGSGHPTVTSDGALIYDRAPHVHRLSEQELRAKGEIRGLFPNVAGG